MLDYKTAPYLELENYKAPLGINSFYIPMKDKKNIRLIYWKSNFSQGTVLLLQGHNEFIEKYYETIQELLDRKFNVVCFDWRGQGLSDKMIKNNNKQFIEDFKIHNQDLQFIVNEVIDREFPKPLFSIAHSMGGCILLSKLKESPKIFDKVILSAPMLGLHNENFLMPFIALITKFGFKENYLIGSRPNFGKETPFEENDLTSDEKRYNRTQELVRKNPDIRLWGITNAWAKAVRKIFLSIREENWPSSIDTEILFINSLKDKVVSPKHIIKMANQLKNAKIINFKSCKHEIFMEKDKFRRKLWEEIDSFL